MNKLLLGLLSGAVLISFANADKVKTFGCGITKNAYTKALNKAYSKKYGSKMIINKKGGAGKAAKLVTAGKIHIGTGCRPIGIKSTEKGESIQVAWGAIVFIVNPKNSVSSITTAQAKDILQGKITNWKDVGGVDGKIDLYLRKSKKSGVGYSARQILWQTPDADFTKKANLKKSSGPVRKGVSVNPNGLGLDDFVTSGKNKKLKVLSINGIFPSKTTISDGSYGLHRPLFIYKGKNVKQKYIDLALSDEGQKIISDNGVVNLKEGASLTSPYKF